MSSPLEAFCSEYIDTISDGLYRLYHLDFISDTNEMGFALHEDELELQSVGGSDLILQQAVPKFDPVSFDMQYVNIGAGLAARSCMEPPDLGTTGRSI